MAIIESWVPPSREHWELLTWLWQFFPLVYQQQCLVPIDMLTAPLQVTIGQWLLDFYPQGKTSIDSRFNIPGKIAWATMEAPGFMLLLYIMYSLPKEIGLDGLPAVNWVMAALFVSPIL